VLAQGGRSVGENVTSRGGTLMTRPWVGLMRTYRIFLERQESQARWVFVRFFRSALSRSSSAFVRSSDLRFLFG
jgi:hypothetical protein